MLCCGSGALSKGDVGEVYSTLLRGSFLSMFVCKHPNASVNSPQEGLGTYRIITYEWSKINGYASRRFIRLTNKK